MTWVPKLLLPAVGDGGKDVSRNGTCERSVQTAELQVDYLGQGRPRSLKPAS